VPTQVLEHALSRKNVHGIKSNARLRRLYNDTFPEEIFHKDGREGGADPPMIELGCDSSVGRKQTVAREVPSTATLLSSTMDDDDERRQFTLGEDKDKLGRTESEGPYKGQ